MLNSASRFDEDSNECSCGAERLAFPRTLITIGEASLLPPRSASPLLLPMSRTVTKVYEGLWRRKGIWRSNGTSDLTTQVWWFQSPSFHIDLRIPADRPSTASMAEYNALPLELRQRYAAQTGFAGLTVVEGDRCEWRPVIAFPSISDEIDAGWMRFDSDDALHETGLDSSYEEDWVREPTGPVLGVRLDEIEGNRIAFLLISSHWLAWACGRSSDAFRADSPTGDNCTKFLVMQRSSSAWRPVSSNLPDIASAVDEKDLCLAQVELWKEDDAVSVPFAAGHWQVTTSTHPSS